MKYDKKNPVGPGQGFEQKVQQTFSLDLNVPSSAHNVKQNSDPLAYGGSALRSECEKIAAAPEGVRNETLNSSAYSIGRLVSGGAIPQGVAYAGVEAAGLHCGLPAEEVRSTILNAFKAAASTPRSIPPRVNRPQHASLIRPACGSKCDQPTSSSDEELIRAKTARTARLLIGQSIDADPSHPYLVRKRIHPSQMIRMVEKSKAISVLDYRPKGKKGELQGEWLLLIPCFKLGEPTVCTLELIDGEGRKAALRGKSTRRDVFWTTHDPEKLPEKDCTIYIGEGFATVASVIESTNSGVGFAALSNGNIKNVALQVRKRFPEAEIIILADIDKKTRAPDAHARTAAEAIGGKLAAPDFGSDKEDEEKDFNDLYLKLGVKSVLESLAAATQAAEPETRYKPLSAKQILEEDDLPWVLKNLLPAKGLAFISGASGAGKSFLVFDLACCIAEGRDFFGIRSKPTPVFYVCLEGEGGLKNRIKAWQMYFNLQFPAGLRIVKQPFHIDSPVDRQDLIRILPNGSIVIIDTLNRSAPVLDENSSKDMGLVLEGAKDIERSIEGLVILITHVGKDPTKGMRGHSCLQAAADSVIEVAKSGKGLRRWKAEKSKESVSGREYPFVLKVVQIGIDGDGDNVTSCVVVPEEQKRSPAESSENDNHHLLHEFIAAAKEEGELDEDGKFVGIHLEKWRPHFYAKCTSDSQPGKKKAFQRARDKLVKGGLLVVNNDLYSLASPDSLILGPTIAKVLQSKRDTGQERDKE